jgi:hypothetical protein
MMTEYLERSGSSMVSRSSRPSVMNLTLVLSASVLLSKRMA